MIQFYYLNAKKTQDWLFILANFLDILIKF